MNLLLPHAAALADDMGADRLLPVLSRSRRRGGRGPGSPLSWGTQSTRSPSRSRSGTVMKARKGGVDGKEQGYLCVEPAALAGVLFSTQEASRER